MTTANTNYKIGKFYFSKFVIRTFGEAYTSIGLKVKIKQVIGTTPHGGCILACHHENDFDPFVINRAISRRLNWVARARMFGKSVLDNKLLKWMTDLFGVISIDHNRNEGLFDYLSWLMSKGEAIVMFPEGNLLHEREGRKFGEPKDGVIRIIQHAESLYNVKFPIYPVGLAYRNKYVVVKIGNPFYAEGLPEKEIHRLMKEIKVLSCIYFH